MKIKRELKVKLRKLILKTKTLIMINNIKIRILKNKSLKNK